MKRISILVVMLLACLVSVAWGQQPAGIPHFGKYGIPSDRTLNTIPQSGTASNPSSNAQVPVAEKVRFYDLGTYPGGIWALTIDVNDFGVAVGWGDVPPSGYVHPIAVPLQGPNAGNWFDLGTLGGDESAFGGQCTGVANNGMIVGNAAIKGGDFVHAFAWTPNSGMVDIGTLADRGDTFSSAWEVNKSGTLIVGFSGSGYFGEAQDTLPVVWTREVGGPRITWTIHKLDTEGFSTSLYWNATAVNDSGQIIGTAVNSEGNQIAVLWNPDPHGGWKTMQLHGTPDYPGAFPTDINDSGVIAATLGSLDQSSHVPALWKPVGPRRSAYKLTRLAFLTGFSEALGINDRGDIVGYSMKADGNSLATLWSARDPHSVEVLGFPGTWSWAIKVNNNRIAVGSYGSDTIPQNAAGWQFR
jgi:probable HAF family extracellular repeat protein